MFVLICSLETVSLDTIAQSESKYDQYQAFAPLFYPSYGNDIRSASGAPGPKYWQNEPDYKIDVSLDDVKHEISGAVIISYKNNSPEKLPFVWLQLDQNIYSRESRANASTALSGGRYANQNEFEGGYNIKSVSLLIEGKEEKAALLRG